MASDQATDDVAMAPSGQLLILLVTVSLEGKLLSAGVQAFMIYAAALLAAASTSKKQLACWPTCPQFFNWQGTLDGNLGIQYIKVYREWALAKEIRLRES